MKFAMFGQIISSARGKKVEVLKFLYKAFSVFLIIAPILIAIDGNVIFSGTILTIIPIILGLMIVFLQNKKSMIKYSVIAVLLLINLVQVSNFSQHFEMLKPFLIFLLMLDIMQNDDLLNNIKANLEKNKKFLNIIIWLIAGVNLIMYITNTGISESYSKQWKLKAFQGMFFDPNQAAYRLCTLIVYTIFLVKVKINNKYLNILLVLIFEFLILMTGARVPTGLGIALGMIAFWNIKDDFIEDIKKYKKIFICVGIIIVMVLMYVLPKTAFLKKIINEAQEGSRFDNGRGVMRNAELEYFNSKRLVNKLFGNDIIEIKEVNKKAIASPIIIWCHNDMLQILLQFGLIIFIIYICTFYKAMATQMKGQNKMDKLITILLYSVFAFVAFFNGLFYHPRFVISIPILFMIYKKYNKNNNMLEKSEKYEN